MILYAAPPIAWWIKAIKNDSILMLDFKARYEKMSYRNRYRIGAANGSLMLSIPILGGRNQRIPIDEVKISYQERWQNQHWKSIESAYRNTPFFEHYESYLLPFYSSRYELLANWNFELIQLFNKLLKLSLNIEINNSECSKELMHEELSVDNLFLPYHQPFEHRHGFLPNLSIIDLLFCVGPTAKQYLR